MTSAAALRQEVTDKWIALPMGGSGGNALVYRDLQWLKAAGFDSRAEGHTPASCGCARRSRRTPPGGFALGNAVGDGNNWATGCCGRMAASWWTRKASRHQLAETLNALEYSKQLYADLHPGHAVLARSVEQQGLMLDGQISMTAERRLGVLRCQEFDPKTAGIAEGYTACPLPCSALSASRRRTDADHADDAFKHTRFPNAAKAYVQFMMEVSSTTHGWKASIGYCQPSAGPTKRKRSGLRDPKLAVYRDTATR
jgi:multiple sugar transport system substrate-binding protein